MEKPLQELTNLSTEVIFAMTNSEFQREISIIETLHIAPSENVLKHLLAHLNEGQEISA